MAALSDTLPSYLDWARRLGPDGNIDTIIEILSEENPTLEDCVVLEANGPLSHRTTVRSGIPAGTWRRLNYGVPVQKGKTKQITDTVGSLETYAEVDKDLADLNGNTAAWRMSEEAAYVEGLSQTMANTIIYGNTDTDPERFMGLAERYNDLSADNGRMVVQSATGDTGSDNTSIWGIVWGPRSVHKIFPKGSTAGLSFKDLGEVTLEDDATPTGLFQGYRSHYQWKAGLVLRDWRQVTRIQVDVADFPTENVIDLMIEGYNQLKSPNNGRLVWYTTRAVKTILDKEAVNKTNMALAQQQQDNGGPMTTFWGAPVKMLEALLSSTEDTVA